MDCIIKIKIEKQEVSDILLERDILLYKIPLDRIDKKPGHCHKAQDWDISNPVGVYKLILLADDSDSCHIQLKDANGDFFGYGIIDCCPGPSGSTSSSSITPVVDSSCYFVVKIRKLSSGQDELIGIGFISQDDSSSLTNTLEGYFTSGDRSAVRIAMSDKSGKSSALAVNDEFQDQDKASNIKTDNVVDNPYGAAYHDELRTWFWCPMCPSQSFATTDRKEFFMHLKDKSIHGRRKRRICGLCSLMFNNRDQFMYHANIFHFTCSACNAPLRDKKKLKRHLLKIHRQTLIIYRCNLCPNHFTVHDLFIKHYKMKHPDPPADPRQGQSFRTPQLVSSTRGWWT